MKKQPVCLGYIDVSRGLYYLLSQWLNGLNFLGLHI